MKSRIAWQNQSLPRLVLKIYECSCSSAPRCGHSKTGELDLPRAGGYYQSGCSRVGAMNGCGDGLGNSMGLGDRQGHEREDSDQAMGAIDCRASVSEGCPCLRTKDGEVGNQAGDESGGTGEWDAWDRLWQCGLDVRILMSVAQLWES